jgi:hypothetical protein
VWGFQYILTCRKEENARDVWFPFRLHIENVTGKIGHWEEEIKLLYSGHKKGCINQNSNFMKKCSGN